jgi:hypothetical protein
MRDRECFYKNTEYDKRVSIQQNSIGGFHENHRRRIRGNKKDGGRRIP